MKQAIIVRKDLKMSCGKIAGQVAHASIRAYNNAGFWNRTKYFKDGEVKVILKVNSEEELIDIMYQCMMSNVKYAEVRDAGKTQIEPNTLTAVGIGPYKDEIVDKIVGDLKLL